MTTLTGILRDSDGNPITGTLWLELSQAGIYNPGTVLVTPLQPSVFNLTGGSISGPGGGPYTVYGNDGITPSVTFYRLTAFDAAGSQVLRLNVRITGASVDFGALTIAPTQSWVAPPGYAVSLTGDASGLSSAVTVTRIHGKSVVAPPWTPGHVVTVQADQSLAPAAPTVPGLGTLSTQNANAVAITGGTITGTALQDKGGQVFNVKAYGAVGNGSTDDTAAINAAITAAAAVSPRGVVFFPPGTFATTGAHALDGLSGLSIVGAGTGSTVLRLTHATNDLFTTGNTVTVGLTIRGFTVTSDTVTRTAGWVFRVNTAYNGGGSLKRSYLGDLEIVKQFNGISLEHYEFVRVEGVLFWDPAASTTGIGVRLGQTTSTNVNQGSEAHLTDVQVYGNNLAGGTSYLGAGFRIEDTDAVYLFRCGTSGIDGTGLKMVANSGGHTPTNHFFEMCVFDSTKAGPSAHLSGTGNFENLQFAGCWFASAGKLSGGTTTAPGLLVDCSGSVTLSKVVSSVFYNTAGNGIRVSSSSHVSLLTNANTFSSCGTGGTAGNRAAIYISVPAGNLAPTVTNCYEANSGLYSIETAATATKVYVSGNKWLTATSYGVVPDGVLSGTYTPTLTAVLNVAATSGATAFFSRVDNVVHVSGYFQMDPTSGSTQTKVGISLPIPSNIGAASDLSGHANRDTGVMTYGRIVGDPTNDRAEVQYYLDADAFNRDTFFTFSYRVI